MSARLSDILDHVVIVSDTPPTGDAIELAADPQVDHTHRLREMLAKARNRHATGVFRLQLLDNYIYRAEVRDGDGERSYIINLVDGHALYGCSCRGYQSYHRCYHYAAALSACGRIPAEGAPAPRRWIVPSMILDFALDEPVA